MAITHASLPLPHTDAKSLLFKNLKVIHPMKLDSTKCPYCQSPTVIREVPEYEDEREGIYFPYEIVITCTGVHKGKQLDIADWYNADESIDSKILQKYTQDDPDIVTHR